MCKYTFIWMCQCTSPWVCCVSLCVCVCVCVFVCVCVISNQSTSKKPHYVIDLSKLDALLQKTHQGPSVTKVPRLDMCRSIMSLSNIAHQMWHNHPFSQRNKTTERAVGLGVWMRQGKGIWTKFEKVGVGNIGGTLYQLWIQKPLVLWTYNFRYFQRFT